jgi:hypothetical protein
MSKEQVKSTEDKKPVLDKNDMGYEVEINGKDFLCFYYFLEDKLYHSAYVFTGEHTNKNDYINDCEELKESLTQK